MAGLFGTDGVRARINTGPMTAEAVVRVALAAGRWFADHNDRSSHARPIVVIGKDTRLSGYMLESALVAGFTSIGLDCRLLGPIPTPAVAHLTRSLRAELGVMISASHNPHHDNGIKLFGPDGFKLDDKIESEISAFAAGSILLADAPDLGRARRMLVPSYFVGDGGCDFAGRQILAVVGPRRCYRSRPRPRASRPSPRSSSAPSRRSRRWCTWSCWCRPSRAREGARSTLPRTCRRRTWPSGRGPTWTRASTTTW